MKKNNSLKLFNKLAKRAYKVSKKRDLGWKWSDAQKWTSKNLYQKYKGTKNLSKLKVTKIDVEVIEILDGTVSVVPPPPKPKKYCFSPFAVGSFLLESFEWFDIDDKVSILNDDLQVDLDLEYNGNVFAKTGVIKKDMLPNLKQIREDMRTVFKNGSDFDTIGMYIVLIEGAVDDETIPCNYYVLITFENSTELIRLKSKGLIKRKFVTKEQMPTTELERIELELKQREEEKKILSKQKAQNFKLPSKVEPKVEPKIEPKVEPAKQPITKKLTKEELKTIRWQEFNKAKESYRKDLDDKLITKKEYKNIILKLESKLEKGGKI